MQSREYQRVLGFLNSLKINFSPNWVTACINEIRSQNNNISPKELGDAVYQKWLSVNLRQLKAPSLPPNILSYEKITLSGEYAVQVESMMNSAKSCYSELQRIRGVDTDNEITENPVEETNSKRCLTFVFCDGVQEVEGMEYQPIPSLKLSDFFPGFKMLLTGPIICRKGMLLLKEENVKILGGKVDSLWKTNNLEALLVKALGLESNCEDSSSECDTVKASEFSVSHDHGAEQRILEVGANRLDSGSISHVETDVHELLSDDNDFFSNVPLESDILASDYNTDMSKQPLHHKEMFSRCLNHQGESSRNDLLLNKNEAQFKSSASLSLDKTNRNYEEEMNSVSHKRPRLENNFIKDYNCVRNCDSKDKIVSSQSNYFDDDINIIDDSDFYLPTNVPKDKRDEKQAVAKKNIQTKMPSFIINSQDNFKLSPKETMSNSQPATVNFQPYIYLKQLKDISLTKDTSFIVKAIILTLKSKIGIKNNEFELRACISDGSHTVQVNFCSDILENILEYSPCEITKLMSDRYKNSAVGERLKEIFSSAQQKLLSMNCLMEVKFFTNQTIPLVVKLEEVQSKHVAALKGRAYCKRDINIS